MSARYGPTYPPPPPSISSTKKKKKVAFKTPKTQNPAPRSVPATLRTPQSLIELVVATIASRQYDDPQFRQALLACNLASRAFHAAASKFLFYHVHVREDLIFRPGLRQAFAARPEVFFEIRSLIISIDQRRSWISKTSQGVKAGVKDAISHIVQGQPSRPFTVQDLLTDGKLDTFCFHASLATPWGSLPSAARLAIITAWQRQTPKRFAIVGLTDAEKFYLAPRKSSQGLQEFTIYNTYFKPAGSTRKAHEARAPTLEVLTSPRTLRIAGSRISDFLEGEQIRLKPPSTIVKTSRVKRLSICLNHQRHAFELLSALYLFRLVSKSLHSLTIEGLDPPPPHTPEFPFPLSLDELDHLTDLRIITWEPLLPQANRLAAITRLLSTRKRRGVRNIRILLNWTVKDREDGYEVLRAQQKWWSDLDQVLLKLMEGTVRLIAIQVVFSFSKPRVSKERATLGWLREVEFHFQRGLKRVFESTIPTDLSVTATVAPTPMAPTPGTLSFPSSSPARVPTNS